MNNIKTLLSVGIFAAFLGGLYLLSTSGLLDTTVQITQYETAITELVGNLVTPLATVNAIQLDTSLFTRSDYKALKNVSQPLPTPSVSRVDPFAGL
jgi:hypothetical protein